ARDEPLLEEGQAALLTQHVQRLEDLRAQEPPQQLVATDPLEQRDQHVRAPAVIARGLDRGGDERVVRAGGHEIALEQWPRRVRMLLREAQEREVAASDGCLRVGNDGTEARDAPARPHERRCRRMLPAFELRNAKGHEVAVAKRAAALEHREQPPVYLRERRLDRVPVRPARKRQRLPGQPVQAERVPHALERCRVASGEQPLQGVSEPTQALDDVHALKLPAPAPMARGRLSTPVWKTAWKSCDSDADNVALALRPA